jgi:phosphoribosylglycinamide formyltransferase-1
MKNIAIFASGNGTNAERIAQYFENNETIRVQLILTNKPGAGVLKRAAKLRIPTLIFNREVFYQTNDILEILKVKDIDLIVLAGFLWLIPGNILHEYPNRIVNIHPALLPKYGGKGMFGHHVHDAVIASNDAESGITIHYVNEKYDEGQVIFQSKVAIDKKDNPDTLAEKIHVLEYRYFPKVIEELLQKM